MTYTIIKNAEPVTPSRARRTKYPFGSMDVNDAFDASLEEQRNIANAANSYGSRNGKKFSTVRFGSGVRCQRVA